ncbi:MAG TPA: DNA polymerase/3'-5' exonuclease PolX [Stellaceae bacterium]|nr:DNA polymerase/3'-5' exonuclease PolX [Stellaceae bacterium]
MARARAVRPKPAKARFHNTEIADALDEIADLLELQSANPFRVRAYRNGARTVRGLGMEVSEMLVEGRDLSELPGIGKDLATKLRCLAETGTVRLLDELHREVPAIATELLHLSGLGPKRVRALYEDLEIHSLEQLKRALLDGRVDELPGFGPKIVASLKESLAAKAEHPRRFKRAEVRGIVEPLVAYLEASPGVERVTVAGSYRRRQETVGDIDILATAEKTKPIMDRFVAYPEVAKVLAEGPTRSTVVLRSGIQVDIRIVPNESYGAALHYFTGSKAHNIAVRQMGQKLGYKINEYGVFKGKRRIAGDTELSVYKTVDLPYIEPELRENRGEFEAARAGKLPKLVERGDLRGDLHAHTTATDGHDSLEAMAKAARERGFEYLAITEHSRRLTMAHGLDPRRLAQQIEAIDRLNAKGAGVRILKGIEVDILEDGKLDLPDDILARLDLVVGAVHSKFSLSREQQTERILKGMRHPYFTILAHPSGRLIEERPPYDVDMPRIIRAARERGSFLELNAHPDRLDLSDVHCRMAKEAGVLVSIASDAHRASGLDDLVYGVDQARRGWLEKRDVLNTRPLAALEKLLAGTRR